MLGDNRHGAKLADEVRGKIDAFYFKGAESASARPLVVGPGGIRRVPDRQAIVVRVIGKPLVDIIDQPVIVFAAKPLEIVVVLPGSKHGQLRQEGLELLAVALLDQAAIDVAVGLFAVEKLLEIGEAVGSDSEIGKIEILEIQVPVVSRKTRCRDSR
jgi:hypothetical protein